MLAFSLHQQHAPDQLARLNRDGKVDTTFMDTAYNQFAG